MNSYGYGKDIKKKPLFQGKSELDTQIGIHLLDVNTRNGWNLDESEPPSFLDTYFPLFLFGTAMIVVILVKMW